MRYSRLFTFLIVLLSAFTAKADVFTVTSNADSGPGTLREALTLAAANGSTVQDFIYFNLPDLSEAGRTITILGRLPNVSSNLQIDASTQPGSKFGISDARVKILMAYEDHTASNNCLYIYKQTNVGVYALFFDRNPAFFTNNRTYGIYASVAKRIEIGAPGKGCVVINFEDNIAFDIDIANVTSLDVNEDVKIQSNFIAINEDGASVCLLGNSECNFFNVKNLTLGGKGFSYGNCIFGHFLIEPVFYDIPNGLEGLFISNNRVGLNSSATAPLSNNSKSIASSVSITGFGTTKTCEITNNIFSDGISINVGCYFTITGNKFGTDITGNVIFPHKSLGIVVGYCTGGGKIGGTLTEEKNIFAGSYLEPYFPLNVFGVINNISSPGVEVLGNVFKCNSGIRPIKLNGIDNNVPVITSRLVTSVKGTAPANSRVDLYYSIECSYCEPQQLFASVISDANGNWQFSGNILNYAVIASSTNKGSTSEFSSLHFTYALEDVKIQPACNGKDGSIKGISSNGASTYEWYNEAGIVVANTQELVGAIPGKYYLVITSGDCAATSPVFEIKNTALEINTSAMQTTPVTCNNGGSITGITAGASLLAEWRDQQQNVRSGTLDLINVEAGSYSLTVFTADKNCSQTIGPFEIKNATVPSLDLTGQGGRSATCNENNGSITGLKTTNASTYQWTITGTNTVKSTQLDLTNVPAGFYTLTISNATCSKSYDFEVAGFPPTVFTGITYTKTKTCAAFNTGTITLNTDKANEEPTQYLWLDEQGTPVGYTKEVQFLKSGKYTLQLTNKNFCPVTYPEVFVIEAYPEFNVTSFGTVTNTQCGVGIGGVSGIAVSGGTGNYTYKWLDADNNDSPLPGKTQPALSNVLKGHYKLRITDGGCSLAEIPYTIIDEAVTPPSPSANNIQVYNTGPAVIKVNSPFPTAIYRIYETATNPQPIKDTIGGNIKINVTESRSYYVSLTYGYCESARTEVKVFLSALNGNIPNTFTPNGDGINDYWNIPGLDTYPNAKVNIFNRYGIPVFQSIGYAKPFDGTSNGKPLPVGVYYYIITLKKGDALSGNVTIIR